MKNVKEFTFLKLFSKIPSLPEKLPYLLRLPASLGIMSNNRTEGLSGIVDCVA